MSYLIVFALGPVQSYISQARRTQDLYQGSRILSYLAGQGLSKLPDGCEAIYPRIDNIAATESIPNRFVLRVQGDKQAALNAALAVENAIRKAWKAISQESLEYLQLPKPRGLSQPLDDKFKKIWERQEKAWMECYWTVTEEIPGDYPTSIKQANQDMATRKMLRNFTQAGEQNRKCSITGEHEALYVLRTYDEIKDNERKSSERSGDAVAFWQALRTNLADSNLNLSWFGESERLSAISTMKRVVHEAAQKNGWQTLSLEKRFPSTSSFAVVSFRKELLQPTVWSKMRPYVEAYLKTLEGMFDRMRDLYFVSRNSTYPGSFNPEDFPALPEIDPNDYVMLRFRSLDGDYLFEDTLIEITIKEYSGKEPTDIQLKNARDALETLLKRASEDHHIRKPQPYFAILSMDGDKMGKRVKDFKSPEEHQAFSKALADFSSREVSRIVEQEHLGRLVYAGGDDVLALLPLHNVLEVAEALRTAFEKFMARDHDGHTFADMTASTGIAIVHHTHNLQQAVEEANSAQKNIAKEGHHRNALAVAFLRRSGESRSMGAKWHAVQDPTAELLQRLIGHFLNDGLAYNLPYDLEQMIYSMVGKKVPIDQVTDDTYELEQVIYRTVGEKVPPEAIKAELGRVVKRRLPEKGEKRKTLAPTITDLLVDLVICSSDAKKPWDNTLHWVELARFLAQSQPTSEPTQQEGSV